MKRRAILSMATMAAMFLVGSGVALAEYIDCNNLPPCYGTPEPDQISGTANGETIYGYGGDDIVFANDGNDTIYGSSGTDELRGEGGSDKLYGGGSQDFIYAGVNDTLGSTDYSYGGGGNDVIDAADGNGDIINCGKGTDLVFYDVGMDTVRACENRSPS